jgi:hypothetical protein
MFPRQARRCQPNGAASCAACYGLRINDCHAPALIRKLIGNNSADKTSADDEHIQMLTLSVHGVSALFG